MLERFTPSAEAIVLDATVEEVTDVAREIAACVARLDEVDIEDEVVEQAFTASLREGGIALGRGLAMPHAVVPGVDQPLVGFLRLRDGLEMKDAPDRRPVDLFPFVLAVPGDERLHLQVLAHLARRFRSDEILEDLRRASTEEEVRGLLVGSVEAGDSEGRSILPEATTELMVIEVEGEVASDRLLLDLAGQGHDDAIVLEGQALRRSLSRHLPLFAGFRDLFGDPGARRLVLLTTDSDQVEIVVRLVRRACRDSHAQAARVVSFPVSRSWAWTPAPDHEPSGHG